MSDILVCVRDCWPAATNDCCLDGLDAGGAYARHRLERYMFLRCTLLLRVAMHCFICCCTRVTDGSCPSSRHLCSDGEQFVGKEMTARILSGGPKPLPEEEVAQGDGYMAIAK